MLREFVAHFCPNMQATIWSRSGMRVPYSFLVVRRCSTRSQFNDFGCDFFLTDLAQSSLKQIKFAFDLACCSRHCFQSRFVFGRKCVQARLANQSMKVISAQAIEQGCFRELHHRWPRGMRCELGQINWKQTVPDDFGSS